MERLLKTIALIGLGLFLFSRLVDGSVYYYINQRFIVLTLLAAAGFILVGGSLYKRPHHPHNEDDSPHHDHEDHNHSHLTWFGLLIILLPILLGWLVPPKPLGANAFGNREINVGSLQSVSPPGSNERMGLISGEKNIIDWLIEIQNSVSPEELDGQEAHIIGFVYRDGRFNQSQFLVGRFIVSCCVADASPVGLIVQGDKAADFDDDQWVEVHGHFETKTFDGEPTPVLIIDQIEAIEQPAQPYLYG
jgi:uncharacterized repeat protein (TIGR03943 family)